MAKLPADSFNDYVLQAVQVLYQDFPHKGYDIHCAYTHTIDYCVGKVNPTKPPLTMCVAAVAEVIITALNLYMHETSDTSPCRHLSVDGWNKMRPTDIRSYIWVDPRLNSYGTADALVHFGVGKHVAFSELTPGSFINLNRNIPGRKPSGHAVIFLSFLDQSGNEMENHSSKVAGFKYFSSQGKGDEGGFGFRYGFFMHNNDASWCPTLSGDKKRDCGITYSENQKYLNTGYMLHPKYWEHTEKDNYLKGLMSMLYRDARKSLTVQLGLPADTSFEEFAKALDSKDTMRLNPIYLENETTDD